MEMSSGIFCQELWILTLDFVIGKIKIKFQPIQTDFEADSSDTCRTGG